MREQGIALKDRVDLALVGRHLIDAFAVEQNIAGCRRQKASDDTKRGGLAAAAGAQQGEKLPVIDVKIDRIEDSLAVKLHHEIGQTDQLLGHLSSPISSYFCGCYDTTHYCTIIRVAPHNVNRFFKKNATF